MQEWFFKYIPEYPAEIFSISLAFALLKTENYTSPVLLLMHKLLFIITSKKRFWYSNLSNRQKLKNHTIVSTILRCYIQNTYFPFSPSLKSHQIPQKLPCLSAVQAETSDCDCNISISLSKSEPKKRKHPYLWPQSCEGISDVKKVSP